MTVKLPEKAGFVPTVAEWDQLVRIAENLAAQLAQAQAERDAAQRDLITLAENWHASEKALDAARAEVARLNAVIERYSNPILESRMRAFIAALRGDTAPAQPDKSAMDEPAATVTAQTIKWEGGRP